jgi:putative ABC transport system permease protein
MLREFWNDGRYRVRALVRRDEAERALNAEIDDHLARQAEALERAGWSRAEARRQARLAFGGLQGIKEHTREAWGTVALESSMQDIRHGIRQLRRNPVFACSGILVLALGIAAVTVVFSIVYGVLLRDLPYDQPDRLVTLGSSRRDAGFQATYAGAADYFDWRDQQQVFDDLGLTRPVANYNLTGSGEPERLQGARATASVFSTLRVRPVIGRVYTEEEQLDAGKASSVAVLSYGLWQRRFGGDPSVVGRTILLNGSPHQVVGVMGADFQYPNRDFELWTPLYIPPNQLRERGDYSYLSVARLKAGVTLEQARAHMSVLAANLARDYSWANRNTSVFVEPMLSDITGSVHDTLLLLLAAVGVLFLVGGVNLANLLLARATKRAQEFSLRASLGATRSRLARQFFAEAIPLAIAGAVAGIASAQWLLRLLIPLLPASMPRIDEIGVHGPVLLASIVLSVAAVFLMSLAPAAQIHSHLERGPAPVGRARAPFVVVEIACTVLLLVTAGLLMRSFAHLRSTDAGFRPAHVLSLHLAVSRAKYGDDAGVARYLERLIDTVRIVPGVASVGIVNRLPMGGQMQAGTIQFEGKDARFSTDWRSVSADYYRALSVPLVAGRTFNDSDIPGRTAVGLIDERLARAVFAAESPIGKRFKMDFPKAPWVEIVGVVGHVRQEGLDSDPRPQVYWPHQQRTQDRMAMVVRTTADPSSLTASIRSAIHDVDAEQPLYDVRPMPEVLERTLRGRWINTVLIAVFAALALLLAGVGLYGVVSYVTTQRRREFAIRLAVGAKAWDVLTLVLEQGLWLALVGVLFGLMLSAVSTRALGTMLYGVTAWDTWTYLLVSGLMIVVVLTASLIPAWQASRLDPKVALEPPPG